ncbi:MAG: rhomboid family intramembrane serine protease [Actinomycetes bacterium]
MEIAAEEHVFDWALLYAVLPAFAALGWFAVRGLARRDVPWARRLHDRLDPRVQAIRTWLFAAPATSVYTATWVATTIIVVGSSPMLVDALTVENSTNIVEMFTSPVRASAVSALLVADQGLGLAFYVVVFALIVARLEQRIGTPRTLVIWLAAHVGASLITVAIEIVQIKMHDAPLKLALTSDVGVSYVMVGSLGAYLFLVGPRWRWWYVAALAIGVLGPLLVVHEIDEIGHFLATTIGAATGWALIKVGGLRPQLLWKQLAAAPPRALDDAVR